MIKGKTRVIASSSVNFSKMATIKSAARSFIHDINYLLNKVHV